MEILTFLFKVVAVAYVALLLLAYFYQDVLIFMAQPLGERQLQAVLARHPAVQEVRLLSDDRVVLHGWFSKAAGSGNARAPLVIYFGGNAEEVSWLLDAVGRFPGHSLLLVNYRGYGGSGGRPGEAAMFADALQVFDYAAKRDDVDAASIVLMGRSLGTGMAVHVAARRAVRGVVLVSPYDSMVELGRRHHPYLPASLLLRHRFESHAEAPRIKAPMLALVAARDSIVPPAHSRRLVEAWGGPHAMHEIDDTDHNDISGSDAYWQLIGGFLAKVRVSH